MTSLLIVPALAGPVILCVPLSIGSSVCAHAETVTANTNQRGRNGAAGMRSPNAMRNIRENLIFAFAYNAIGIPISAGVLYPAFAITCRHRG
jgi:Cu+-exporting ATPase